MPAATAVERTYYDNSMLSSFKECPRKFYLRHVRGWTRSGISMPLTFGLSWHNAMDTLWLNYGKVSDKELIERAFQSFIETWTSEGLPHPDQMTIDDITRFEPRTPYIAKEMLHAYLNARRPTFNNPSFRLEHIEQPFAVPLYPATSSNIWYIGRLDKVFNLNGQRVIGEHKTTTEYKKDGGFKTSYLEGWSPAAQIEGYLYAGNLYFDGGVRYVWVDAALVHKKEHGFFKFIPIAVNFAAVDGWLWEVREWVSQVSLEKEKLTDATLTNGSQLQCFRRNTDSCVGKYGPCSYLEVCRSITNPQLQEQPPEGYKVEFWQPFEILGISQLGGDFATAASTKD
jgi:hypothetical protein